MKKIIKTKNGEKTFFVRRPPKKIEKIFEKFLNEYLKNVCKILPQSYRSQQMKAGGVLAEAVLIYETKFLKKPFEKAIKGNIENEIEFIQKALEQLKGYGCGYHKNLQRFMEKRMKSLKGDSK